MLNSDIDPDAALSPKQWAAVAESIELSELPRDMKQEIADALFDDFLLGKHKAAANRRALQKLTTLATTFRHRIFTIQTALTNETTIKEVEALIEHTYAVQKLTEKSLASLPKLKGGRPKMIKRDTLAETLLAIYEKHTGKPIGLSRTSISNEPSGPCYRFVCTILEIVGLPTSGVEHVIERARDRPKNLL